MSGTLPRCPECGGEGASGCGADWHDSVSPHDPPTPYYQDEVVTLYHGDCRDVLGALDHANDLDYTAAAMVVDPPYGINYTSNSPRDEMARSIVGDTDTTLRDALIDWFFPGPMLVFGTWKAPRPKGTKGVLIWDKGGALGMGDLSMPWKFDHEEIYVLGAGFVGKRDCGSVLRFPPVQSMAKNGRVHPHEKPVSLLKALLGKCPEGTVIDPTCGSGSTLVAAKAMGRKAVGIEIDEAYCEVAVRRLAQGVLA